MQTVCVCAAFAPAEMLMCLCGDVFLPFFPRTNYIVASWQKRRFGGKKEKCFGYTSLEFFCFMLVYISWDAPTAVVITIPSSNSGLESFFLFPLAWFPLARRRLWNAYWISNAASNLHIVTSYNKNIGTNS